MKKIYVQYKTDAFFRVFLIWTGIFLFSGYLSSQPMASSKQMIEGLEVFNDFKKKNVFYYGPGKLVLSEDVDGKPDFQLLEMRYTGTMAYADQMEKRFFNVVQFTVKMESVDGDKLKNIKQKLGGSRLILRPLPIKRLESILVAPVQNADGDYTRIGKSGGFEAAGSSGKSSSKGFWTERTFTLKLENHEAQLIWDQVETGKLALSFGYAFYADVLTGGVAEITTSGSDKLKEKMAANESDIIRADTMTSTQVIKSEAFPIRVDVEKWPGTLKKIDINEEVPPAYAALEIKCYDFSDDLRPDLAIKSIEIHATGVGGSMVKLPPRKFMRSHPDLNTLQVRFPYAVKMNKPLKYKVTEYTLEGEKTEFDWKTQNSWAEIIDITTPVDENLIGKKELEIEADPSEWPNDSIQKVEFILQYSLNGEIQQLSDIIDYDDQLPIKTLSFQYDLSEPLNSIVRWYYIDDTIKVLFKEEVLEEYVFLNPPG